MLRFALGRGVFGGSHRWSMESLREYYDGEGLVTGL